MDTDAYHHGDLRDALIDRAVEIIAAEGVAGVSFRGLARDLDVSHSAPARHFKTKADLLSTILEEAYEDLLTTTVEAADLAGEDPISRLRAMARAAMRWHLDNQALSEVMRNPDVGRYATRGVREVLSALSIHNSRAIIEAQGQGKKTGREPEFIFLHMLVTVVGAGAVLTDPVYVDTLPALDADELIDDLVDYLFPLS
jgi:AcrR family transcriptional regulator